MSLIDTSTRVLTTEQVEEQRAADNLPGEYRAKHRLSQRIPADQVARARRPVCEAVRVADEPTQPLTVPPPWPLPREEQDRPGLERAVVFPPSALARIPVPLPAREVATTRLSVAQWTTRALRRLVANRGWGQP